MHRKGTEIQQVARVTGSDINLQDIVDSIKDELL